MTEHRKIELNFITTPARLWWEDLNGGEWHGRRAEERRNAFTWRRRQNTKFFERHCELSEQTHRRIFFQHAINAVTLAYHFHVSVTGSKS